MLWMLCNSMLMPSLYIYEKKRYNPDENNNKKTTSYDTPKCTKD